MRLRRRIQDRPTTYRSCRIPRPWSTREVRLAKYPDTGGHKRGPRRVRNPGGRFQIDFPENSIALPILDLVHTSASAVSKGPSRMAAGKRVKVSPLLFVDKRYDMPF